jgi:tRNA G10  N-methylase Trm11
MEYVNIFGSDISAKAIEDTRNNVRWMKDIYRIQINPQLKVVDACQLSRHFKINSVGAIVTETYLGPQRGEVNIQKVSRELSALYNKTMQEMWLVLEKGKRVVIALPAFMVSGSPKLLEINFGKFKIINNLPQSLHIHLGITSRDSFLYGRDDQKVWREIIILEK